MRILHIHSDRKFVELSDDFTHSEIQNSVIILGKMSIDSDDVLHFDNNKRSYHKIARLAEGFDVVVFFSMCLQHAYICNQLPKHLKVIWRFFGGELYQYIQRDILTEHCRTYVKSSKRHHILSVVKNMVLYGATAESIFWHAVKRTDYFMCLAADEYNYLKKIFPVLPPFLQVPYRSSTVTSISYEKEPLIIIGHSKNIDGNHLDVLNVLDKSKKRDCYHYIIFFSYSEYSKKYSEAVINFVRGWPTMNIIRKFLPFEEFNRLQHTASALVINAKRQIAVGNIWGAICNGMKVYLHPDNVLFNWFIQHNIKVYSTKDLFYDVEINNIRLSNEEINANIAGYNTLIMIKLETKRLTQILLDIIHYQLYIV